MAEERDAATALVETIEAVKSEVASLKKGQDEVREELKKASSVAAPPWMTGAPALVFGERSNSRPFHFGRLFKGLVAKAQGQDDWRECAKNEIEFCERLAKANGETGFFIPLSSDYLTDDGSANDTLRKEWKGMVAATVAPDADEYAYMMSRIGKDMTYRTATTGGTLVAEAAQGELIELLRATSLFGRIPGVREVPIAPQGATRYPRVTSGTTITAYAESEAVTESTPGTGEVVLQAKKYAGMVDFTEEFVKFATSVSADAFIRGELAADYELKVDRDTIDGPGGKRIQGLIGYSGVSTHTATTGSNGNTLEPEDLDMILATIASANVNVDNDFFFAMRPKLWSGQKSRSDSAGMPKFQSYIQSIGGGRVAPVYSGYPVFTTTQIPNTRVKGSSGATLTLVLAGVGNELMIGRSGMVEMSVTNSDGTNFQNGIMTMRLTGYTDRAPRHEEAFGLIDQLLES